MNSYRLISDLNSDEQIAQAKHALQGRPWSFINLFPFTIQVWRERERITELVGEILGGKTMITSVSKSSGLPLEEEDIIHVLYPDYKSKSDEFPYFEITRPALLRTDSRTVRIGDVVYGERDTNYHNSHADLAGVRIHNHTTIPLDIYHHKFKLGSVEGDEGTTYMSGTPNSVYLDNDRNGFRIGDELTFVFRYNRQKFNSILLMDPYIGDIYVGVINQKFTMPNPDVFGYRVDAPNITGITYYDSRSGYISEKSNPYAPF